MKSEIHRRDSGLLEPWDATERRWCGFSWDQCQLPPPADPGRYSAIATGTSVPQSTIDTTHLGVMKLDERTECYESVVDGPYDNPIRFSIYAADIDQLPRLEAFVDWFQDNHRAFKGPLEYQIQNHDLVWDDVWDEILGDDWVDRPDGFLADYLNYRSVDLSSGKLCVWVETGGLHTDHMVRATIDDKMEIECCEML